MITTTIAVDAPVAEYITAKFYDAEAGAVRFPSDLDLYVLIWDLLKKRPATCPVDSGNLTFALPCRRGGKDPESYNYLSERAAEILNRKMRTMMWAELHDAMEEGKHLRGLQFKEIIFTFMCRYGIESIGEDALFKNYQRWRYKLRRTQKRDYRRRSDR